MCFDIIIPTYNNLDELKACLNGFAQQADARFKAIICIDGSTDGTREYLSSASYPFPIVVAEHPDRANHGRNATRNLAIPHITAAYVLLLDSDAVPAPDLIERHRECLKKGNTVSVGIINYTNTKENVWAQYTATRGRFRLDDGAQIGYHLFNSGNAALRSDQFLALNGQDAAMRHYGGGDTDFAVRLFDRFKPDFINNQKAVASSVMNKDLSTALQQMIEFGQHNLRYLEKKHPAHPHLYSMNTMKRHKIVFWLISIKPLMALAHFLIQLSPKPVQNALIRYLVVANLFHGFTSE